MRVWIKRKPWLNVEAFGSFPFQVKLTLDWLIYLYFIYLFIFYYYFCLKNSNMIWYTRLFVIKKRKTNVIMNT